MSFVSFLLVQVGSRAERRVNNAFSVNAGPHGLHLPGVLVLECLLLAVSASNRPTRLGNPPFEGRTLDPQVRQRLVAPAGHPRCQDRNDLRFTGPVAFDISCRPRRTGPRSGEDPWPRSTTWNSEQRVRETRMRTSIARMLTTSHGCFHTRLVPDSRSVDSCQLAPAGTRHRKCKSLAPVARPHSWTACETRGGPSCCVCPGSSWTIATERRRRSRWCPSCADCRAMRGI